MHKRRRKRKFHECLQMQSNSCSRFLHPESLYGADSRPDKMQYVGNKDLRPCSDSYGKKAVYGENTTFSQGSAL